MSFGKVDISSKVDVGTEVTISGLDYNTDYEIKVNDTVKAQSGTAAYYEYIINCKTASLIGCDSILERQKQGFVPTVDKVKDATYTYYLFDLW